MLLLTSPPNGPGAVRRFLLPGLFVIALFVVLYMRRPVVVTGDVDGTTYTVQTQTTHGRDLIAISGETMGTTYQVKIAVDPENDHDYEEIGEAVATALADVNKSMSTYQSDSELSLLNGNSSPDWIELSAPLASVLNTSLQVSRLSEGAFDPTIGPVVNAWGFGPEKRSEPPSADELEALKKRVGWESLKLKVDAQSLKKAIPEAYIDLSAVAKGYGVDQVARSLDTMGLVDYLVEVGGELRARGVNSAGVAWRVGIEAPEAARGRTHGSIRLVDRSMATSGDYRNYREVDGKRVSHTIDPRTARPIEHRLASVTVVAADCADADAWATALNVLGPDDGVRVAQSQNLAAYFLIKDASGELNIVRTEAFRAIEEASEIPSDKKNATVNGDD